MKQDTIKPEFVEFIPEKREDGLLYISTIFSVAVHNCCCGCGMETVTPLGPDQWEMTYNGEEVTLNPSIGNQQFECQSHYLIRDNKVIWL